MLLGLVLRTDLLQLHMSALFFLHLSCGSILHEYRLLLLTGEFAGMQLTLAKTGKGSVFIGVQRALSAQCGCSSSSHVLLYTAASASHLQRTQAPALPLLVFSLQATLQTRRRLR